MLPAALLDWCSALSKETALKIAKGSLADVGVRSSKRPVTVAPIHRCESVAGVQKAAFTDSFVHVVLCRRRRNHRGPQES